jgi:hypothetical protein
VAINSILSLGGGQTNCFVVKPVRGAEFTGLCKDINKQFNFARVKNGLDHILGTYGGSSSGVTGQISRYSGPSMLVSKFAGSFMS